MKLAPLMGVVLAVLGWAGWLWFNSVALAQSPPPVSANVTVSLTIQGPTGDIRFNGDAFPNALMTYLSGQAIIGTSTTNGVGFFDKTITGLEPGIYNFGVFASAADGRSSPTIRVELLIQSGSLTTVSDLLIPPIVTILASQKRPVPFIESGLARPNSTVTTFTNSHNQINNQALTNSAGEWTITIRDILHLGNHTVTALVNDNAGRQSQVTNPKFFTITQSADLNIDNRVGLFDFSILMFNYGSNPPPNWAADINDTRDAPDLADFSLMMFHWTGD